MNSEREWKAALARSSDDNTLRLAYADWLEEQGEQLRACQVRQDAGAGTLVYSLWHPSWGNKRYGEWKQLAHLQSHVRPKGHLGTYRRTYATPEVPVSELVVIVEWRANPTEITRLPYSHDLVI
jgi:uncharacterized protein (TIGR02996 family)